MIDYGKILPLLIEGASFVSAFAAIAAGIIMAKFIKKFVSGILSTGFKAIGVGIFILAIAIIVDTALLILNASSPISIFLIARQILLLIGTYIIVIASKTMGDKLETLSKHQST